MSQSVAYYNVHAQQFMDETLHLDMSALYDAFCRIYPKTPTFSTPAAVLAETHVSFLSATIALLHSMRLKS